MSKRKRARRERRQEMEHFAEALSETIDYALDFIEHASPFEISSKLAELGVSTTHRAGIEQFLNNWRAPQDDPEPIAAFEALAEHWISEIEKKRLTRPDFEDDILLTEIARFFWIRLHPETLQGPV